MPAATSEIREIVVMGGALEVAGNVGNPYVGIDNAVHIQHRYDQEGPGSLRKVVRHTGATLVEGCRMTVAATVGR